MTSKATIFDGSICPGNFHDYPDDETALQRELEIGESIPAGSTYVDTAFPPNARSLYFDPLNPPKGSVPNESLRWCSISQGTLLHCDGFSKPYWGDVSSPYIRQGALGDAYFVDALSLLATQARFVERVLVSFAYASRGLYTLKFYKAGRWRYVHIDDFIPCRQSGKANFARNRNPNETFAMLVEKAYAKLHGCYEALSHGLVEQALRELTPAAGVQTLRLERMSGAKNICDEVWDALEKAVSSQAVIGCGRFVEDQETDNPAFQQGITPDKMYQVLDICVSSAEPTENLDALTVGMVCVRNLQPNKGRFTGRWSFGHRLWTDYKEIAADLRNRTREIQHQRGLGPHPNDVDNPLMDARHLPLSYQEPAHLDGDEPDTLDIDYIDKQTSSRVVQPMAIDLQWIQIEDFVDIFNRIYIVNDLLFDKKAVCRRFVSKWLPGDFIVGSGGPPVIVSKELIEEEEEEEEDEEEEKADPKKIRGPRYLRSVSVNDNFTDNPMFPFSVTEPAKMAITLYQVDKRWNVGRLGDDPQQVSTASFLSRTERLESVMQYPIAIGFLIVRLSGMKHRLTEFRLKKIAATCEAVTFAHSASAFVTLFPGRYAIIPYTHAAQDRALDYALHCHFLSHQVEFEIDDPIAQRLQDKEPSEEGIGYDEEPDDNDLLRTHENDDDVSVISYEIEREREDEEVDEDEDISQTKESVPKILPLPRLLLYKRWEYAENVEELSMNHMFGEVDDMMNYVRTLKEEIRRLTGSIRALVNTENLPVPNEESMNRIPANQVSKK